MCTDTKESLRIFLRQQLGDVEEDSILPDTGVLVCQNMTREAFDSDCLLPTYIFKGILISHLNSFVVVNPRKASRRSQEPANTVLLTR